VLSLTRLNERTFVKNTIEYRRQLATHSLFKL
jgi:hypothetical protein